MYELGISLGFLLLLAKFGSFHLLTGGNEQWKTKHLVWSFAITLPLIAENYWLAVVPIGILIFFLFIIPDDQKEMGVRDWCYSSNARKGLVDLIAGYLGMHVLAAFGGSIIAMIAMVTYTVTCMAMIFGSTFLHRLFPPRGRRRKYAIR